MCRSRWSIVALLTALMLPQLVQSEVIILERDSGVKHGRGWGPEQALGAPDTPGSGDIQTAWASATPDDQDEWLELEFDKEVMPTEVVVHETYNPGALHRVTAYTKSDMEAVIWTGKDPTPATAARGISRVKVDPGFKIKRIRIHLKSKDVTGWNEIDAVGLKDKDGKTHWAISATASSTFAGGDAKGELPKALRDAAKLGADLGIKIPIPKIGAPRVDPPAIPRAIADPFRVRDAKAVEEAKAREELLLAEIAKLRAQLAVLEAEDARMKAQQVALQIELNRAQALLKVFQRDNEQLRKEKEKASP